MNRDTQWMRSQETSPVVDLHTDQAHPARVYDAVLGGKTNYAADRAAARNVREFLPALATMARVSRTFMHRVARFAVAEAGIRQFLDVGTGIPTSPNLHEVAQSIAPESRVVYTDNDPIVLTHSRALHTSDPAGATTYVMADARDPGAILSHPEVAATLDMSKPVALTMLLLLHWLPTEADTEGIVRHLVDALPAGSCVAITHAAADLNTRWTDVNERLAATGPMQVYPRSKAEIARFFTGLDLVSPGIVVPQLWRPDAERPQIGAASTVDEGADADVPIWAAVAMKF